MKVQESRLVAMLTHTQPLHWYKDLTLLKLNDVSKLELVTFVYKLHHNYFMTAVQNFLHSIRMVPSGML